MHSISYAVFSLGISSWIWWFGAKRAAEIWCQTLRFEEDALLFFDGRTRHKMRLHSIARLELVLSPGGFHSAPSWVLSFHPRYGDGVNWNLSDFSLRVVFRVLVELRRRIDVSPVDVYSYDVPHLNDALQSASRRLGTLSPVPRKIDEDLASRPYWERFFEERRRHVQFTPN